MNHFYWSFWTVDNYQRNTGCSYHRTGCFSVQILLAEDVFIPFLERGGKKKEKACELMSQGCVTTSYQGKANDWA